MKHLEKDPSCKPQNIAKSGLRQVSLTATEKLLLPGVNIARIVVDNVVKAGL